ncbi:MAG: hypothetical protein WCK11_01590 [Candidatus Falkowbacteria bacterium]
MVNNTQAVQPGAGPPYTVFHSEGQSIPFMIFSVAKGWADCVDNPQIFDCKKVLVYPLSVARK